MTFEVLSKKFSHQRLASIGVGTMGAPGAGAPLYILKFALHLIIHIRILVYRAPLYKAMFLC